MKRLQKGWIWILVFCLLLCACGKGEEKSKVRQEEEIQISQGDEEPDESEITTRKLRVKIFGEERVNNPPSGYTYMVGNIGVTDVNMYTNLLNQFAEENDIKIEISYSNSVFEGMSGNLKYYDVLIGELHDDSNIYINDTYNSSLYDLIEGDYFYDMASLFERDGLYEGDYITSILEAGRNDEKQVAFPLTFTINMLYTSEQSLDRHNLNIHQNSSFDDLEEAFSESWHSTSEIIPLYLKDYEIGLVFSSLPMPSPYLLFGLASGYEPGLEDVSYYMNLMGFNEAFLISDSNQSSDEIRAYIASEVFHTGLEGDSHIGAYYKVDDPAFFATLQSNIGCFSSGYSYFYSYPFIMQTMHYESLYEDIGESFLPIAIPEKNKEQSYQALITTYGMVTKDSPQAELGYQLLKYLADANLPAYYDLPVNKKYIATMLKELQGMQISVTDIWDYEKYTLPPMSEETATYLQNVIDHIDSAVFFDKPTWKNRIRIWSNYVAGDFSIQDAAIKIIEGDEEE